MNTPDNIEEQNKIFSALADNNRRKVIELLHRNDSTLMELSESFSISFQALSKHIQMLEEAGIIIKKKQGKYRILSLNREPLKSSLKWISFYSDFWNESFDTLDALINQKKSDDNPE